MAEASCTGLCATTRPPPPPPRAGAPADHMTVATLPPPEDEDGVEGGVAICCCGWTRCAVGVFTTCVVMRVRGILGQAGILGAGGEGAG